MNVFELRDTLIRDYASYVGSFIELRHARIRERVRAELKEGLLWPDPLIQLNPSFEPGEWIDELVDQGLLHDECRRIFRKKPEALGGYRRVPASRGDALSPDSPGAIVGLSPEDSREVVCSRPAVVPACPAPGAGAGIRNPPPSLLDERSRAMPEPSVLRFLHHDSVALGAFNPAILDPQWMVRMGILPEGNASVAIPVGTGGLLQFGVDEWTWSVSTDRLVVEERSRQRPGVPGETIAKILEQLPHTPTRAIGHNFRFQVEPYPLADLHPRLGPGLTSAGVSERSRYSVQASAARFILAVDDARLLLEFADDGRTLSVNANVERPAPTSRSAVMAALRSGEDYGTVLTILRDILEMEVVDA